MAVIFLLVIAWSINTIVKNAIKTMTEIKYHGASVSLRVMILQSKFALQDDFKLLDNSKVLVLR
jgi:hypothetical protein